MSDVPPTTGEADQQHGGSFYDDPEVFERYRLHREWSLNPNTTMEEPALLEELGSVDGALVLDLGCGNASIGRTLLDAGAASYFGIDGSERMIQSTKAALNGTTAHVERSDIEGFQAAPESFDLVLSRLALHYIEDIRQVLTNCHRWLSPGGRIVFTVVHPVITSHDARATTNEPRQDWVVDDYFVSGATRSGSAGPRAGITGPSSSTSAACTTPASRSQISGSALPFVSASMTRRSLSGGSASRSCCCSLAPAVS
jgi:SAM-dependent methyltransferase